MVYAACDNEIEIWLSGAFVSTELDKAYQNGILQGSALQMKAAGKKQEFQAQCLLGCNQQAEAIRKELHDLLDMELDNSSSLISISKQKYES